MQTFRCVRSIRLWQNCLGEWLCLCKLETCKVKIGKPLEQELSVHLNSRVLNFACVHG